MCWLIETTQSTFTRPEAVSTHTRSLSRAEGHKPQRKCNATPLGDVQLSASAGQGIRSATHESTFCGSNPIDHFLLVNDTQEAPADGKTPIGLVIKFVDSNEAPTDGGQQKPLSLDHKGVGRWQLPGAEALAAPDWTVWKESCVLRPELVSDRAGKADVKIGFRTISKRRSFSFYAPITTVLLLATTAGALLGTFARIFQPPYRHRTPRYYVLQSTTGAAAGIGVFLASYFGTVKFAPSTFPGGSGIGFLLGLIGGYLGSAALDYISKPAAPVQPPRVQRNNQHFA